MLQSIATTILVDVQVRYVVFRVGEAESSTQVKDTGECLPAIFVFHPLFVLQWIPSHALDNVDVRIHKLNFFVNSCLVESHQVGCVYFQPSDSVLAKPLCF